MRETRAFLLTTDQPFERIGEPGRFEADARDRLRTFLGELDVEAYLLGAGVTEQQLAGIRSRLVN